MDRRVVGKSCFYSSSPRGGGESLSQDLQYVRVHRLCLGSERRASVGSSTGLCSCLQCAKSLHNTDRASQIWNVFGSHMTSQVDNSTHGLTRLVTVRTQVNWNHNSSWPPGSVYNEHMKGEQTHVLTWVLSPRFFTMHMQISHLRPNLKAETLSNVLGRGHPTCMWLTGVVTFLITDLFVYWCPRWADCGLMNLV